MQKGPLEELEVKPVLDSRESRGEARERGMPRPDNNKTRGRGLGGKAEGTSLFAYQGVEEIGLDI